MPMKYSAVFILDYTAYMYQDLIIVAVVTRTLSSYSLYLLSQYWVDFPKIKDTVSLEPM
jgi:hypothetical protein